VMMVKMKQRDLNVRQRVSHEPSVPSNVHSPGTRVGVVSERTGCDAGERAGCDAGERARGNAAERAGGDASECA
jgi:hypothetical protein